jgi:hypothetical protein
MEIGRPDRSYLKTAYPQKKNPMISSLEKKGFLEIQFIAFPGKDYSQLSDRQKYIDIE